MDTSGSAPPQTQANGQTIAGVSLTLDANIDPETAADALLAKV
jgi:hypothetical protein